MRNSIQTASETSIHVPAVSLLGITKRYPGVIANADISLDFYPGEIHVLLGENGAGKSTLISILSGMTHPDAGDILIEGEPVLLNSPREALEHGIGTVYQHPTLVPALTVLQNLMLGGDWRTPMVRQDKLERFAEFCELLGVDIDPNVRLSHLSLGQQQQVEIIKALWNSSKLLILDESTVMLSPREVEDLLSVVSRLQKTGLGIVFITHKLSEAVTFGDRISIIKRGRNAGAIGPDELNREDHNAVIDHIVEMMFGGGTEICRRETVAVGGKTILSVENLSIAPQVGEVKVNGVSFDLSAGEVLGIAGVEGNGQKILAEGLAGQRKLTAGYLILEGKNLVGADVRQHQRLGIRYVTDDRLGEGTVGDFDISANLLLKRIGEPPFWVRGLRRPAAIDGYAAEKVSAYDIRTSGIAQRVATLSGGNIQKVLLARELADQPRVVIFNKPTHGLDRNNIIVAHRAISEQAAAGVGTIVISTDLDEILALSDRIAVMLRGEIVGIITNGPEARQKVGELMIGYTGASEAAA